MFFIEKTPEFDKWLRKLKELKAKEIWKNLIIKNGHHKI
jgi:putative component of toxin-antitoxin plasmid stabilization module